VRPRVSVRRMITSITHTGVWVHDLDEALDFYTGKLGFEVRADIREPTWSWTVVAPLASSEPELMLHVPGPPFMDQALAEQVLDLIAKGALSGGILATDDCRREFETLTKRGVEFYQEPVERSYGIDAAFRDPTGNSWRITQRSAGS
jgi:catechol 2,3-dioxygenase-like lactoylglutathione lyase family enzyme